MRTAEKIEAKNTDQKVAENSQAKSQKRNPAAHLVKWRWPKGFCPNPSGRPKRDRAAEIAREIFEQNPELLYQAYARQAAKGNAYAFQVLADRAYGKLPQRNELTGAGGGPVEIAGVNDGDINERIAQLERDLGLARAIDEAGGIAGAQAGEGSPAGEAETADLLPR